MTIKKLIAWILLLALVPTASGSKLRKYPAVQVYEIETGIFVVPIYSSHLEPCKISIEKRHYSNNAVDLDAVMSKEQILSIFDELVPQKERGGPGLNLPSGTEISDIDLGTIDTKISYVNVTLEMIGKEKEDSRDIQKYVAAIITWNKSQCHAK